MGCVISAEDYTPPSSGATEQWPRLVLTTRGQPTRSTSRMRTRSASPAARLTLRNGMAVVPRYDYPRKIMEWSYIELGLGPRHMAMRVRLDEDFLVRVHDERVFDIAWWKYEVEIPWYPEVDGVSSHRSAGNGGPQLCRKFRWHDLPQKAQPPRPRRRQPTFSFVPAGSPLVCRFQHAKALAAGQQVAPLASHPGLAVVQIFDDPREAFHEWHYKALGLGPASKAVMASRQGSFFVDKAGWYRDRPSMMNVRRATTRI